ncbi:glycerophosphodiester phosphodiesterase family protein [Actibacterium ureilyticum]|uniref:glycerophosphodiester phosphodiesterase family protein n=1 Tax=Actibacterium ureilyticum TaxID=1590614 RepID=UPI000BAB1023|nr:glycerophosphodiester phosphodiesterase family protein [Actibacterium ureilyticum]
MIPLPPGLLTRPIAHRGYHDRTAGVIENSRAALRAALAAGYGAEIDVQLSADGQAMVFHDYDLKRLTGQPGAVRQRSAADLGAMPLTDGGETIPTLDEVLTLVAGRLPLLIEVKDQDGALGPDVGPLEQAVARALEGYGGDVALMSFNPHSVAALARLAPLRPRGLVTCDFAAEDWQLVPEARRAELRDIPDFDATGASFISHDADDLDAAPVARLKSHGVPILCWTIRSAGDEARARRVADNVTFEGYAAELPGA